MSKLIDNYIITYAIVLTVVGTIISVYNNLIISENIGTWDEVENMESTAIKNRTYILLGMFIIILGSILQIVMLYINPITNIKVLYYIIGFTLVLIIINWFLLRYYEKKKINLN